MESTFPLEEWEEQGFDTPAIVVDLDRLEANLQDMADYAGREGVTLRPHVKTHKSTEIMRRQIGAGVSGITVAKLGEAEVMADAGAKDIFIANQILGRSKLGRLAALAGRVKVSVGIDSEMGAQALSEVADSVGLSLAVLIEVDSGLGRAGLPPGRAVLELARRITHLPGLHLQGLFTHAGHAYGAFDPREREAIGRHEGAVLVESAALLRENGIEVATLSVGSTPTAKISGSVRGVTEIRPGTYVFYDAVQAALGVVPLSRCAAAVVTRVTSRPAPDRAVIDAGSKVLALDQGAHGTSGVKGFGRVLGRKEVVVERLSEEHGMLRLPPDEELQAGDHLVVIPNHICPVINLVGEFWVKKGNNLLENWSAEARGRVR